MEKIAKTIKLISDHNIEYEENFCEFTARLLDILHKIPEEYRKDSIIEFESEYESSRITFNVSYKREETNEEYDYRMKEPERRREHLAKIKEQKIYNEIVMLNNLIKMYPEEAKKIIKND